MKYVALRGDHNFLTDHGKVRFHLRRETGHGEYGIVRPSAAHPACGNTAASSGMRAR